MALGTLSNVLFTMKQVGAVIKNGASQIMLQKNYNMIRSWGKKKKKRDQHQSQKLSHDASQRGVELDLISSRWREEVKKNTRAITHLGTMLCHTVDELHGPC